MKNNGKIYKRNKKTMEMLNIGHFNSNHVFFSFAITCITSCARHR